MSYNRTCVTGVVSPHVQTHSNHIYTGFIHTTTAPHPPKLSRSLPLSLSFTHIELTILKTLMRRSTLTAGIPCVHLLRALDLRWFETCDGARFDYVYYIPSVAHTHETCCTGDTMATRDVMTTRKSNTFHPLAKKGLNLLSR